ncbi:Proton-antipo-M domain-containing protein [Sulfidibacter corallicola]|uniref:NADH:quinone oxidoreductase/Mrp antiporter transmembrane domain-containing protein n=1 Tax=Sulfidibacter corallicola TaxID=2818388 RepID=A0A8A4TLE8_SULCO|nr:proton-conducting transporter membrane subunit [Sulfidibacter corallicola]QTD49942.1 hypothetical protein J3U87_30540 [Sulfidibacter corallicola]
MNPMLILPIVIPLITALALVLSGWNGRKAAWLALIGALAHFAVNISLLLGVVNGGIQATYLGDWSAPYGITLVADNLAAALVAVTGLMGTTVCLFGIRDNLDESCGRGFFPLFHLLLMGVTGAFLAGDIFNLYVWFEVMLIASFILLAKGGSRIELIASVKYVTMNLVSSAIFLAGIGLLYAKTGTLNMADLALKLNENPDARLVLSSGAFFLTAFGIKAAVFPVYFWLPASYHAPPTAVAAIFSGLLTKVGVYALMRTFTLIFTQDQEFVTDLLLVVAGLTMVMGVLGAVSQNDIRRILSFHIISQIGYMIMGLALMSPLAIAGAVFYLIHHIIVKTNLFLIGGIIAYHGNGSYELKRLGGLFRHQAWLAVLFLIPAMSLAGFPPLSGFFSKFVLIKAGIEAQSWWIVAVALMVSVLTLVSMSKIWNEAFWKPRAEEKGDGATPVGFWMPACILASVTLGIGLNPGPLFEFSQETAAQLLNSERYIRAVLGEVVP